MKPTLFHPIKLPFLTALFLTIFFLLVGLSSCSDESYDGNDLNLDGWDSSAFDHLVPDVTGDKAVGQYYQGGIIIALDISGEHGLIAALEDQSMTDPWYNGEFVETNAKSLEDGFDNTQKILEAHGPEGIYAAKLCADYEGGGYDDWFLPVRQPGGPAVLVIHRI